jgi:hypothetical protein
MKRLVLFLACLAGVACLQDRERLEPPRVTLKLADQTVLPGGDVLGTISAADASGIVYVHAEIRIAGDSGRPQGTSATSDSRDTIQYTFSLPVRTGFPSGTPIYVTASVMDNQNFVVTKEDTIAIR